MDVGFLKPLFDRPGPWACAYIDTSRATEGAPTRRRLRERFVADQLTGQGADPATRDALVGRLAGEPAARPSAGRALFAAGGEVVLDVPLAVSPGDVETSWSALPRVAPLASLRGEWPSCLLVHIDRAGADLELRDAGGVRLAGRAAGGARRGRGHRSVPADRHEWHYRNRVENAWDQTAERVADELVRQWSDSDAQLLVLTGDPRERRAVLDRLPEPLRARAVEAQHGTRTAGCARELLEAEIDNVCAEHVRAHLESVLDAFRAGRGRPGGQGGKEHKGVSPSGTAEGVPAVVEAMRSHQAATLLLGQAGGDMRHEVWIGPDADQLAVQRAQARALGVRAPEPARADDALMRSAAVADTEVLLVPEGVPGPAGGLGALLRWYG
ncbi:Vms1/Ankzf1 family peptidyl-tRNA hydrolase [Streptomyces sp. NPDC005336]|uniref:baeRF2 domain-containing protein n=1 Tax=Streptomyces sp. NPDC005336 TaxID=3157035 RepID=UPI00339E5CC4